MRLKTTISRLRYNRTLTVESNIGKDFETYQLGDRLLSFQKWRKIQRKYYFKRRTFSELNLPIKSKPGQSFSMTTFTKLAFGYMVFQNRNMYYNHRIYLATLSNFHFLLLCEILWLKSHGK